MSRVNGRHEGGAMSEQKRLDRPNREKQLGNDIVKVIDYQFRHVHNLSPSAYADSLKIIKRKSLALIPDIEEAKKQVRERINLELSEFVNMLRRAPEMHGDIQADPLKTQEFLIWWQALKEVTDDKA